MMDCLSLSTVHGAGKEATSFHCSRMKSAMVDWNQCRASFANGPVCELMLPVQTAGDDEHTTSAKPLAVDATRGYI